MAVSDLTCPPFMSGCSASASARFFLVTWCCCQYASGRHRLMPRNMTHVMHHGFSNDFCSPSRPTPRSSYTAMRHEDHQANRS